MCVYHNLYLTSIIILIVFIVMIDFIINLITLSHIIVFYDLSYFFRYYCYCSKYYSFVTIRIYKSKRVDVLVHLISDFQLLFLQLTRNQPYKVPLKLPQDNHNHNFNFLPGILILELALVTHLQ